MSGSSAWQRLEKSLRRLRRLRELDAPAEVTANEVALAKKYWSAVPPAPAGMHTVWPEDIRALAAELGFEPDPRRAPALDPALANGITLARRQYEMAAEISREIEAAGGVQELAVLLSESTLVLRGTARDVAARERATVIARRLAPSASIDNRLRLRSE